MIKCLALVYKNGETIENMKDYFSKIKKKGMEFILGRVVSSMMVSGLRTYNMGNIVFIYFIILDTVWLLNQKWRENWVIYVPFARRRRASEKFRLKFIQLSVFCAILALTDAKYTVSNPQNFPPAAGFNIRLLKKQNFTKKLIFSKKLDFTSFSPKHPSKYLVHSGGWRLGARKAHI